MLNMYRRWFPKRSTEGMVFRRPRTPDEMLHKRAIKQLIIYTIAIILLVSILEPPNYIVYILLVPCGILVSEINFRLFFKSYFPPEPDDQ